MGRTSELTSVAELEIRPVAPFDFRLTVKKPAGWDLLTRGEIFEDETLWTGVHFEGRPIGLRLSCSGSVGSPRVTVSVFSRAELPAAGRGRLARAVGVCIGAEQDLTAFYAFARKDGILKHVVESLYGMHDTQGFSLFSSVLLAISLQMARLKRSMAMMDAIHEEYGETVAFDGKTVVLPPTPARVARLDPAAFARRCNLGYRAKFIVASAKMLQAGFPDLQEIMGMPPERAKEKLTELPGVGDYAADIINPHGGFPIDAWSVDVFGLLFFGELPADRREAIEKVKEEGVRRWGRWSWMAFFYVAQDLENLSRQLGVKLRLE